jgi:hypothetical protein
VSLPNCGIDIAVYDGRTPDRTSNTVRRMQSNCQYPKCHAANNRAYAVARENGRRPGIPVCGECVAIFAERRDRGEAIQIFWL